MLESINLWHAYFFIMELKGAGMVARKYKRLTYENRKTLEKMIRDGEKVELIAFVLGVHRDTIYKEFQRCGVTDYSKYDADEAQRLL